MQFSIDTKELQKKLELVGRVSTKHVTLPVLQCVVLEVTDSVCVLRATNLEIGIEAELPATVLEAGVVAVSATVLIQTINLVSATTVEMEMSDGVLVVKAGDSETAIKTNPVEEFPTIPKITSTPQTINRTLFSLGIKTAGFAASQSSIKPELGSICVFQKKEHTLTFVATDSFRLMEKTVSQKNVVLDEQILIPHKNALEISRICDSLETDPQLLFGENQCALQFPDGVYVTSRLTTGSFPDYNQIIPKEYCSHVTVLRADLVSAFKKTGIFLNKFFQVGLHVTDVGLTVTAQNNDVGNTTESIKASVDGEELNLNFNQRYITECLGHFVDDSVVAHFAGIGRPVVFEGVNDRSIRYLVMPMNK